MTPLRSARYLTSPSSPTFRPLTRIFSRIFLKAHASRFQRRMNSVRRDFTPEQEAMRRKLSPTSTTSVKRNKTTNMSSRQTSLELTDLEATLKRLLLDTADYINQESTGNASDSAVKLPDELVQAKLELRFTGGWVRDKLLGVGSHDIDIAINKMTGEQFGLKLQEYLEIPGNVDKYQNVGQVGLHKIEANPEKSKHLETITTKIFGLDIDLVNLRKETYTEDSRNPQIEFGTPEEDALRRDATVNAMFYNLGTSEIEDFTGRGFEDMGQKIIRTPLEPYQTFKDDPLRVLRLIRFASRLGYTIDSASEEAMQSSEIKADFARKITRERVGVEFEKMLKGPDPRGALDLINRLDLYDTVYLDPSTKHDFAPEYTWFKTAYTFVSELIDASKDDYKKLASHLVKSDDEKYIAWVLASLIPYADVPDVKMAKGRPQPLAQVMAREGIKVPNRISDIVLASVTNLNDIRDLKDRYFSQRTNAVRKAEGDDPTARDTLGMAIRKWGPTWRQQITFSLLHEIVQSSVTNDSIISSYVEFLDHISTLGLSEAYTFKPLLDGTTIAKALSTKPGPWMKDALEVVMAWQLLHPECASQDEALEALKPDLEKQIAASTSSSKRELPLRLAHYFLSSTLRTIFAQTNEQKKHGPVTASGHKNTRNIPTPHITMSSVSAHDETKQWKHDKIWALDLLRWSILILDHKSVEKNWPLLIPPIMVLLDDIDVAWKTHGVDFLTLLLERTSSTLLSRTGLGDIFSKELLPLFTYMPSLTPEEDSVRLLNATFPALLALVNVQYPTQINRKTSPELDRKREKFLDSLIRKGVFAPYLHAGEHVHITETLLTHLIPILDLQGIDSVKHLKDLIPLLSKILSDPLGPKYPPLLLKATEALQCVIRNGKPRMPFHFERVLGGLTICWVRLENEEDSHEELRQELRRTVVDLRTAVEKDTDVSQEFEKLAEAEKTLAGLLYSDRNFD